MSEFKDDYETGNIGVTIFEEFFGQKNTKHSTQENKEDYDVLMNGTRYEIKCNYHDDGQLILEEWYDRKASKRGWIVTSKSDYIVFVSAESGLMLIYPMKELQDWYKSNYPSIVKDFTLHQNKPTVGLHGDIWTSEYRRISMTYIPIRPLVLETNKEKK